MLTKEIAGEYVTITPEGVLEYKRVENILEDGVVIASKNWRTTYEPDQAPEDLLGRAKTIAEAVWSDEMINTFKRNKAARMAELEERNAQPVSETKAS
jgi:predicted dinucleotide-binding enzyme